MKAHIGGVVVYTTFHMNVHALGKTKPPSGGSQAASSTPATNKHISVASLEGCKGCNCTPRFFRTANCTPQFLLISTFFQANICELHPLIEAPKDATVHS